MTSLQDLLHRKDTLLCLLESSAKEADAAVRALLKSGDEPENGAAGQDLLYAREVDRKITADIHQELHNGSFDAVDAEEIQQLSDTLYKIPKLANKFRERLLASPDFVRAIDFAAEVQFLAQATETLVLLVRSLQRRLDVVGIKGLNERLQAIQGEAHERIMRLYKDLFSGYHPAEKVIALKELYELLEKVMERAGEAGDIVLLIARKNC